MIPNNSFYMQHFPFAIMPLHHYFPDPNIFWTYNQPQFFNYGQSDNKQEFLIKFTAEQINVVETESNLAVKQLFEQIQKPRAFNQTGEKSSPIKCLTSLLSSSPQFNLTQSCQEGISEKYSQDKQIQKLTYSSQKQVSAKCQYNIIKQKSQKKDDFNFKSEKNSKTVHQTVKTEAIEVQLSKATKQTNHWKRTILPNMYQVIFAYLTRRKKSQHRVKRLFDKIAKPNKKMSQNYSLQRYFQYQALLRQKLVYCVNEQKFGLLRQIHDPHCSNFQLEQQMYYNKVSRMVVRDFIEKELLNQLLHKERSRQRENDEQKEFYGRHMEMYRKIKEVFKKTFTI